MKQYNPDLTLYEQLSKEQAEYRAKKQVLLINGHIYSAMRNALDKLKEQANVIEWDSCYLWGFFGVQVTVRLLRGATFADLNPLLELAESFGVWDTVKNEHNNKGVAYIFHKKVGDSYLHVQVSVEPHTASEHCHQVQVGTAPVYEWKCEPDVIETEVQQ